jgi:hypothetical protein
MTEFRRIRSRNENPTTCRVLKLVSAFVNVNGRDRVLNPGPLSRRPDKSTTTPRSATILLVFGKLRGFSEIFAGIRETSWKLSKFSQFFSHQKHY